MNIYTLTFKDQSLEEAYKSKVFDNTWTYIKYQMVSCTTMSFVGVLVSIINLDPWILAGCLLFGLLHAYTFYVSYKYSEMPNFLICASQITILLMDPLQRYLGRTNGYLLGSDSNIGGFTLACFFISSNFGTSFPMKICVYLAYMIVENTYHLLQTQQLIWMQFLSLFGALAVLNTIYYTDKNKRDLFLLQKKEIIYDQSLEEIAKISVVQCKLGQRKTFLELDKVNHQGQIMLGITDTENMKERFRNFKLFHIHPQNDQNYHSTKSLQFNFYQYAYSILNKSDNSPIKKSTTQFYGQCNKKSIYKIKILVTYSQNEEVLVVFITQLDNDIKLQDSLYQQAVQKKIIQNMGKDIQLLGNFQEKSQSIRSISTQLFKSNNKMKLLQIEALTNYWNYRIYMNPRLIMNVSKVSQDSIVTNLKDFLNIYLNLNILIHDVSIQCTESNYLIQTDYTALRLILFNLVQKITQKKNQNGFIRIHIQKVKKYYHKKLVESTLFSMRTNFVKTQNLWMTSNKEFSTSLKSNRPRDINLDIRLLISQHLVGLLGPFNRINYISFADNEEIEIQFQIYNDLSQMLGRFNKIKSSTYI